MFKDLELYVDALGQLGLEVAMFALVVAATYRLIKWARENKWL